MTIEVSREDLYGAIWERPASKVAKEFGISDVALGKICRRYNIPVPGRGYWARVQAGQKLPRSALPKEAVRGERIRIEGQPAGTTAASLRQVGADVEAKMRSQVDAIHQQDAEPEPSSMFAIRLRKRLESARANAEGLIVTKARTQFRVRIAPESIDRTVGIVDRLCLLATAADVEVQPSDNGVGFKCANEFIQIEIIETLKRQPHTLSEAETRKAKQWQAKEAAAERNGTFLPVWEKPSIPEWDYSPSGRLEIRIDGESSYDGLRRRFAVGKTQRVENLLNKVVTGAATCAAAAANRRQEQERRAEERRLAEFRYTEFQRQEALEKKRAEYLSRIQQDWQEADAIEAFLERFYRHYRGETIGAPVRDFLEWAADHADSLRQQRSLGAIAETLQQHRLMDDDTDLNVWTPIA